LGLSFIAEFSELLSLMNQSFVARADDCFRHHRFEINFSLTSAVKHGFRLA
jgi:hypothetical protein